jgi:hypothetical protein
MLQFNGKQERVKATCIGSTLIAGAQTFNLRCPRNGKTDECAFLASSQEQIQLSSLATERLEQALGKAMKVVPSARIPANKVNAHVQSLGWAFVTLTPAGKPARALC